jgi:uncharacterized protein (DUF433 family)
MLTLEPIQIPLSESDGELRVAGTRIALQHIMYEYREGANAEDIVQRFPSLKLGDVHAVLSYYLIHQTEVNQYIAEREHQADQLRSSLEKRSNPAVLRERLQARATRQNLVKRQDQRQ